MTTAPHLITVYQQLLDLSQGMLRHAAQGEWDELISREMEYVSAVQSLAQSTEAVSPSAQTQEQLRPVLRRILDNECEVKRLLQARMDELASLVGQNSRQKSVMSAYSNQGGVVMVPHETLS
ncbi:MULTISPECIES: flagella biosynthesis regulatory protein FliT [Pantoea]|jgi:flagellar protein FliT|uniref:Flagellar protein FliT n=1 Tax=[Curtobacterium] plantarum TaxID=221276 RepID=A0ABT9T926_9GAMM|nr:MULTISPECIES: flagella biosynthesis regulatory protein FliT [Pantoea]EZI31615.1 Flagellar biosynthesis protein FliT [Pantoea agglomerans]KGD79728.1 flagellar biosynthesis protein FliT [Pantoea agglomerans]KOA72368.1 flagellar biosynthesis protein FliT [Pantoea sp. CFSAN033090]KPA06984.1 flagellar biosynthesis protein FliT [Pantoea agglomerans]MBN1089150.1 flagella biosynthesis regulatory protein FliT [Pantoea sp. 1B4]